MANRLTFHYFPGHSPLHRWDARCKLPGLLIFSFGVLHMEPLPLVVFSLLLVGAVALSRLPLLAILHEMKGWSIFLALLFLLQLIFGSHTEGPSLHPWVPVSLAEVHAALLACWRLALILCSATLFTFVTRPRDLQNAVIWFLSPLPFLPARRVALMVALTLRFLPMILDQADEVRLATRCRLGHQRKGLLVRAKAFALPLFRRSLLRADGLALALASRGYRDDLPAPRHPIQATHLIPLAALLLIVLTSAAEIQDYLGWVKR